jgi:hypothetical protein
MAFSQPERLSQPSLSEDISGDVEESVKNKRDGPENLKSVNRTPAKDLRLWFKLSPKATGRS